MTSTTATAEAQARFGPGYRTWLLILLVLIYTCNFIDRSILGVLAQAIKRDLGLSDGQIGMLGGLAFAVFYTGFGIPLARLAERRNRIVLMTVCIAVWSAMTAACGLAQNFVQLALCRVGVSIGEAGCMPAAQSLISDHFPRGQRATALAVFSLGIPFGTLVGAVSGGWIAQNFDWRAAFFIVGLPGLGLAALCMLTLREPPRGLSEPGGLVQGDTPPLSAVLKTLLGKPSALWVVAGATLSAGATYGMALFLAPYMVRRFGLDLAQAGLVSGLVGSLPMIASNLLGGVIADRIARKDLRAYAWTSVFGLSIATPLFVLGFLQSEFAPAMALLVVAAIFQQMYLAPTFAVANNLVEPRMRATSISLFSFVWSLIGMGLGPLIVGVLSDRFANSAALAGRADASAIGLSWALICIVGGFGLGALCYLMASRTMHRDMAPDPAAPG